MIAMSPPRTVRVAVAQMHSTLGQTPANLEHARSLAKQAAQDGAELIAFAELAACGYSMSPLVWDYAETREGYIVQWLQETARSLGVYLGIGFCEVDGQDFFNTYALSGPDGQMAGFVRKIMAERYIFKCAKDTHVIPTPIGRVGVAICADNMFAPNIRRMQAGAADFLLMPHAVPVPTKVGRLVSRQDMARTRETLIDKAPLTAHLLGIPTMFINQVGPLGAEKWSGIIGRLFSAEGYRLGGCSTIAAANGVTCAHLDECSEGVVLADIVLDPSVKVSARPKRYGRYGGGAVSPLHPVFEALCYLEAFVGGLTYASSSTRKRTAREVAVRPRFSPASMVAAPTVVTQ